MKNGMISDDGLNDDLEASQEELKGVGYTAVSFLAFMLLVAGAIIYLFW